MIDAEVENSKMLKGKKVYYKKEEELNRHELIQVDYNSKRKNNVKLKK
jgi:hypothetical protein